MGGNPVQRLVKGHRAADAKALHMIATQLRQQRVFAHGFHTFGQGCKIQPLGHGQDGGDQFLLFGVTVGLHHKGAVDLDPGDTEPLDRSNRGMAGAKVIQIDIAAQFTKRGNVAYDHVVWLIGHHGFEDFDAKPVRGEAKAFQFPLDALNEIDVAQLVRCEIHADRGNIQPGRIPRLERGEGVVQHDFTEPFHQPCVFQRGKEGHGRDHAAHGMVPARQRLEPGNAARVSADLGLEPGLDLAAFQGVDQFFLDVAAGLAAFVHVFGIGANAGGAVGLCLHQGGGGGIDPVRARRFRRPPVKAEPDGAGHVDRDAIHGNRFLNRGLQAACQLNGQFQIHLQNRGQADAKAAVADAGNAVLRAQDRQDPVAAPVDQHIGGLLAVALGEILEIVQFDHEHGRAQAAFGGTVIDFAGDFLEPVAQQHPGKAVARLAGAAQMGKATHRGKDQRQTKGHDQKGGLSPHPEGRKRQGRQKRQKRRAKKHRNKPFSDVRKCLRQRFCHL